MGCLISTKRRRYEPKPQAKEPCREPQLVLENDFFDKDSTAVDPKSAALKTRRDEPEPQAKEPCREPRLVGENYFFDKDNTAVDPKSAALKTGRDEPEPQAKEPRREPRLVTENDFVWPGKKKLIPDLDVFKEIDHRAITAPDKLRSKPAALVAYLIEPCRTELEKFRAIFCWIASHIDYDVEFLNTGRPGMHKVEDCLATGKAICSGYSLVVKELCSHAAIEIEVVSGCTKGGDYMVGDKEKFKIRDGLPTHSSHAWVIVTINGQQFLCDPTWASGKTDMKEGLKVFEKEWNELYFLSDPESFFEEHWPMGDSGESLYSQQLLKSANQNFNDWVDRPHKQMMAIPLGVTLTSHKDGLIVVKESEFDIEFTSKHQLRTSVNLQVAKGKQWVKMEKMTLVYREGDKYKVRVRIPYPKAEFVLEIFANLAEAEGDLSKRNIHVVSYKVVCTGDQGKYKPYHPDFYDRAGIEPEAAKLGYRLESHKSPMIVSKGKESVTISTPNSDPILQSALFYRLSDNEKLDEQVYVERAGNTLVCHLRMYEEGDYGLMLYANLNQDDGSSQALLGNFHIKCPSPLSSKAPPYCKSYDFHGPNKQFMSLGLKDLSGESSIKKADTGGKCTVKFKVPLDLNFWARVFDSKGNELLREHFCGVLDGDILSVNTKLPKPGYFTLGLFQKTSCEAVEALAIYMIENDDAFKGELFPPLYETIGPMASASEAQFSPVDSSMKYHVKTSKADHTVQFVATSNLDAFGILQWKGDNEKFVENDIREEGGRFLMMYAVSLPSAGIFSFSIWKNGSPTKQLVSMLYEYA